MTPASWLCAVVDTLNARQSKQRFMIVGPQEDDTIRIWNMETDQVWTFQCSSERPPERK